MFRRDFIKTTAVGVIAIGVPKLQNSLSDDYGDTVEYKGYKLIFNGFFGNPDSTIISCCWWAAFKNLDSLGRTRFFFATTPGTEGHLVSGSMFDLSRRIEDEKTQRYQPAFAEDYIADPTLAQRVKLSTLERLKRVIDKGEPDE